MMKILAIDTTGLAASAAIVSEEKTIAEITTDCGFTHSQTIMPMISHLVSSVGLSVKDMDYIACSSGPGSFTGLRIGAATAKGLAFGLNKKIVPVPTLDAMAYNIIKSDGIIVPLLDARREQAYTAFYCWEGDELLKLTNDMCENFTSILLSLKKITDRKTVIFLGDGVPIFSEHIKKSGLPFFFAPPHTIRQRAAAVGSLALRLAARGMTVETDSFFSQYVRKPQAEREYDAKVK